MSAYEIAEIKMGLNRNGYRDLTVQPARPPQPNGYVLTEYPIRRGSLRIGAIARLGPEQPPMWTCYAHDRGQIRQLTVFVSSPIAALDALMEFASQRGLI